jgi:predicted ATPase/DNA-binding CsgD family transcriptional regulator
MARNAHSPNELHNVAATNLPLQLTSFIGRDGEIADLKRRLLPADGEQDLQSGSAARRERARLLTLTGPGGCGKTRLAIQVASQLRDEYADGVWWLGLAALSDPALVPQTLAHALGLREFSDTTLPDILTHYLESKRLLLVLDNCEHLLTACAELALRLLPACPDLQTLATSREPLSIPGEVSWLVPSLSLPDPARLPPDWTRFDAIRLFVERAASVSSTFALTAGNATVVAQICQRLDGMPLAIELAAARVKVLTVEQIAARLDDRFVLLTSGNRAALIPRHQTLRATIDWSHDLLSEQERALFYRLSVFAGGFTLEAAESVGTGGKVEKQDVLDLLSQLVDKSLVVAETQGPSEARYRLLETIRQYAQEKLLASREAEQVRERHLAFYVALAEAGEPHLRGLDQLRWLSRLEVEHDNLRSALEWCLTEAGRAEAALQMVGALADFWFLHSHYTEGKELIRRALNQSQDAPAAVKAKVLMGAAWLNVWSGELERPWAMYEEACSLYGTLGDSLNRARALAGLGHVATRQSNFTVATSLFQEALPVFQAAGDQQALADSLKGMGHIAIAQGDHETAGRYYDEVLAIQRGLADRQRLCAALDSVATVAVERGDYRRAAQLFAEALTMRLEYGGRLGMRYELYGLATVAAAVGQPALAMRLQGAVEARNRLIGVRWHSNDQAEVDKELAPLRVRLSEAAFERAWAEGLTMPLERAIEQALSVAANLANETGPAQQPAPGVQSPTLMELLNEREVEVLRLIADGLSNHEIADRLVLAVSTVKWYVNNLFGKLGVRSRTQAVARAKELGLL